MSRTNDYMRRVAAALEGRGFTSQAPTSGEKPRRALEMNLYLES